MSGDRFSDSHAQDLTTLRTYHAIWQAMPISACSLYLMVRKGVLVDVLSFAQVAGLSLEVVVDRGFDTGRLGDQRWLSRAWPIARGNGIQAPSVC